MYNVTIIPRCTPQDDAGSYLYLSSTNIVLAAPLGLLCIFIAANVNLFPGPVLAELCWP